VTPRALGKENGAKKTDLKARGTPSHYLSGREAERSASKGRTTVALFVSAENRPIRDGVIKCFLNEGPLILTFLCDLSSLERIFLKREEFLLKEK